MTNSNRTNRAADQSKLAGGRSPEKQGPGHTHDDDMKHKRSGGDVERDIPEQEDEGTRRGGHSQTETDDQETGGRSRREPGRSRNM